MWVIQCDGSAVPNPGRMGLGALITDPQGVRHTLSIDTHASGCNNEAELRALMAAIQHVQACVQGREVASLLVRSDSSILVEQLGGVGGQPVQPTVKPIERLAPLFEQARLLLAAFDQVQWQWVPRHRNTEADALARAALGMAPKAVIVSAKVRKRQKR
jgi:ribonuclease HI